MTRRQALTPALRPLGRLGVLAAGVVALGLAGGCRPSRMLVIESVPPGAVVRLDEQVIGRTPLEHEFEHYGERRLSLYSPGYRTHSERIRLGAPWYARFPIDLVTEVILPLGLDHRVELAIVVLEPDDGFEAEPAATGFVTRAGEVRRAAREAAAAARAAGVPPPAGGTKEAGADAGGGGAAPDAPGTAPAAGTTTPPASGPPGSVPPAP